MGGTKPSGRPYIGSVLMAIVLLLLGARVAIIRPVIVTGVKTDSNGWLPIGEFSLSLFSSSLEEEFLDDGVFYLAMLDTMVQLLKIMYCLSLYLIIFYTFFLWSHRTCQFG